ncbi:MAG: hypothetical protein DHS20C18_12750 [Saprospiraceae bacterium]|nr:MAG: hypothetical protein DHS20C18_12750 [Saprospiraceae bacterium]
MNETLEHEFTSILNFSSILEAPDHGEASIQNINAYDRLLIYTPDEDYFGPDYLEYTYWKNGTIYRVLLNINVVPAEVVAKQDYAATMEGQLVSIEVLDNDFSSNGTLLLSAIPATNNGSASFVNGTTSISFQPNAGFSGLTNLNYVVCNGAGTCDNGTVSISVMPAEVVATETMSIFTKKNQEQTVLVPWGYNTVSGPNNGTFDDSGETPMYLPNLDYFGNDQITFDYGDHDIVVNIRVLDAVDNSFIFDDVVYTTMNDAPEFNVLTNDFHGTATGCIAYGQPQYGTITYGGNLPKGQVVYTPPAGFTGVDFFNYTGHEGATCGSPAETGTVFVFVSNFEPASAKFEMSTPKQTPLVIGYNVPISNFSFDIVEQPDLGDVLFLQGNVDTTIYGFHVAGYNLILYIPFEEIDAGMDEFQVNYCALNETGGCIEEQLVKVEMEILDIGVGDGPLCFDDCVWAGDTNFDGIVDMKDLLPIGLCMGEIGEQRPNATLDQWYGQYADNWNNIFSTNPIDLKHLDADGDSIVTALDTMAINRFYGRTHSLVPRIEPFYEHEIILEGNIIAEPGDLIELTMRLGSETDPALDIYGFTFPFQYNKDLFVPESVGIEFSQSSWLTYNSPVLYMSKNDQEGRIEAGYTRTSGLSASGHGEIGKVRFVVEDDLNGFRLNDDEYQFRVGDGVSSVMNSAGQSFGMNIRGADITIRWKTNETDADDLNPDKLKLSPNPVNDFLKVHLNGQQTFEQIVIHNISGQQRFNSGSLIPVNENQVDVSQLPEGLYILSVYTEKGLINKKFEIIR